MVMSFLGPLFESILQQIFSGRCKSQSQLLKAFMKFGLNSVDIHSGGL